MKVGDLLIDSHSGEVGLLIIINPGDDRLRKTYLVMDVDGSAHWYPSDYIEKDCEVISESR